MTSFPSVQATSLSAGPRTERRGVGMGLSDEPSPETPEEAAKQFEKVLVRQFVKVMTKDMFSSSLMGDDSRGWMKSQRDRQRDMMTDMITDQLAEADSLQVSEKLIRKWKEVTPPEAPGDSPSQKIVDPPAESTGSPHTREGQHVDHAA